MLFHRCLQHFGRQFQESIINLAQQDDGPFHQTGNLGQQPAILDHLQTACKGLMGRIMPDRLGPFVMAQDYIGTFELCLIIIETGDSKGIGGQKPVPARGVARYDPVHIQRHDLGAALIAQNAQDAVQRAHPFQRPVAPAH